MGVKSPTSLKKNQLINEIIEVVNGKKLPHKNAKGRPINYDVDISRGNKFCRDSIIEREISLLKKRIKKEQDDFLERVKEIIVDFENQIKL